MNMETSESVDLYDKVIKVQFHEDLLEVLRLGKIRIKKEWLVYNRKY